MDRSAARTLLLSLPLLFVPRHRIAGLFLAVAALWSIVSIPASAQAPFCYPPEVYGGHTHVGALHLLNTSSNVHNDRFITRVAPGNVLQWMYKASNSSTWVTENIASDAYGPHVVLYVGTAPIVLYALRSPGGICQATRNGPDNWTKETIVNSPVDDLSAELDAQRLIHMAYQCSSPHMIFYKRRSFFGAWDDDIPVAPLSGSARGVALAVSSNGLVPRVTYANGNQLLYSAYVGPGFGPPEVVDSSPSGVLYCGGLQMRVDDAGDVHILSNFKVGLLSTFSFNYYYHRSASGWSPDLWLGNTTTGNGLSDVSLAKTSNGVRAAWHRTAGNGFTNFGLIYASRSSGTWEPEVLVDGTSGTTGSGNAMCLTATGGSYLVHNRGSAPSDELLIRDGSNLGPITNLHPTALGETGVGLAWTAPGAGMVTAVEYDLRYAISPAPITEANWESHPRATGVPTTAAPGSLQEHSITGLEMCTTYRFALRSKSACGIWTPISNVLTAQTHCGSGGGGGPGEIDPAIVRSPAAIELTTSNPLRGPGAIRYGIPAARAGEPIELRIFDLAGRRARTLAEGSANPGRFEVGWDLRFDGGEKAGPGVYFLRLRVGTEVLRRTVVVIQ